MMTFFDVKLTAKVESTTLALRKPRCSNHNESDDIAKYDLFARISLKFHYEC